MLLEGSVIDGDWVLLFALLLLGFATLLPWVHCSHLGTLHSSFFEFLASPLAFFFLTMCCYGFDGDSSLVVPCKSMLANEVSSRGKDQNHFLNPPSLFLSLMRMSFRL